MTTNLIDSHGYFDPGCRCRHGPWARVKAQRSTSHRRGASLTVFPYEWNSGIDIDVFNRTYL
jgi:hypothetical protein